MLKNLFLAIVICAAVALCIWLIYPVPFVNQAHAEVYHCWDIDGCPRHYRRHHRIPERRNVDYYRTPVAAERPDRDQANGWLCLDPVRGVGDQWIGTEGALDAAKKDWMSRVRYDHGEKFLDLSNSRDFNSRCGRTSIGEAVGQVLYRCEIWARPCKAILKEDEAAIAKDKARDQRQEDIREDHEEREERR